MRCLRRSRQLRAVRQRADDLHMLVPEFDQVNELSIGASRPTEI